MPIKNSSKINVSFDKLYDLYINMKLSYKKIGDIYNVNASTVQRKIKNLNIEARKCGESVFDLDEVMIVKMYIEENKSCVEIGTIMNTTHTTISSRLKKLGIQLRPQGEIVGGKNSNFWNGGVSDANLLVRSSAKYKKWRISVFERDNFICQCCFDSTGGNLQAHHIENFSANKDLRFDINNGITLCSACHDFSVIGSYHHTYGTKNNNRKQLKEYIEQRRKELNITI